VNLRRRGVSYILLYRMEWRGGLSAGLYYDGHTGSVVVLGLGPWP